VPEPNDGSIHTCTRRILPPQKAVTIASYTVDEVDLNGAQSQSSASWHACPTPKMLGLPLALKQLNKAQRFSNESMAVYLLADPRSGFAPPWAQSGLGPVLVARTDGEDFTKEQMVRALLLLPGSALGLKNSCADPYCKATVLHRCVVLGPGCLRLPCHDACT
jgi:hypothetical protein